MPSMHFSPFCSFPSTWVDSVEIVGGGLVSSLPSLLLCLLHPLSGCPYTHSGINRAPGCQEGCHVFDLTWFCSHMFSTSGEHPLLLFLSLTSFAMVGCLQALESPGPCPGYGMNGSLFFWPGAVVPRVELVPGGKKQNTFATWVILLSAAGPELNIAQQGGAEDRSLP